MKKSSLFDLKKLKGNKKSGWILTIIGLVGIFLIFISSMFPKNSGSAYTTSNQTMEEYAGALEDKLENLVKNLTGFDAAEVLVTLESGFEYIYADETTENRDKTEEQKSSDTFKLQEKDSTTQKYITVQGPNGEDVALLLTEIAPKVKGVVVVCPGISEDTRQQIISALMAALDIPSRRIYVSG